MPQPWIGLPAPPRPSSWRSPCRGRAGARRWRALRQRRAGDRQRPSRRVTTDVPRAGCGGATTCSSAARSPLSIVGLAAVGLTMRPVTDRELDRDVRNRDVMLALDVDVENQLDAIVLRQFEELAAGLRRAHRADDLQRIGDHRVPAHRRRRVHRHDAERGRSLARPAQARVRRGHRGGRHLADRRWPGFVRCASTTISAPLRSIVFATDNALAGDPILQLPEAAALARARHPRLRHRRSRPHHGRGPRRVARRRRIDRRGGVRDGRTNDDRRGRRRDRTARSEPPRRASEVVADDRPTAWIVACFAGLGALFAIGWGLRR